MAKTKENRQARNARPRNARIPSTPTPTDSNSGFRTSPADLTRLAQSMVELQNALSSHPKFNRAAPQESPQLLYYVMDFLIRTMRDYLMKLDPDKINSGDEAATELYTDVLSRNGLLSMMITDKSGKSKLFGKSEESDFEFGLEIEAKAKAMMDIGFGKEEGGEDQANPSAPTTNSALEGTA